MYIYTYICIGKHIYIYIYVLFCLFILHAGLPLTDSRPLVGGLFGDPPGCAVCCAFPSPPSSAPGQTMGRPGERPDSGRGVPRSGGSF